VWSVEVTVELGFPYDRERSGHRESQDVGYIPIDPPWLVLAISSGRVAIDAKPQVVSVSLAEES